MKETSGLVFAFPSPRLARRIRQRKQPVQARSRATAQVLLEATLQVLLKEGYAALTTTRVAERAGVSVGTLYQYFPDKHSLVTALQVDYANAMVLSVREAAGAAVGAPTDVALRQMIGALLRLKQENFELTMALRGPMAEQGGAQLLREISASFVELVARQLRASMPRLRAPDRRARVLVTALEGTISAAVYESPGWLGERWFLDELVALCLGYLNEAVRSRR